MYKDSLDHSALITTVLRLQTLLSLKQGLLPIPNRVDSKQEEKKEKEKEKENDDGEDEKEEEEEEEEEKGDGYCNRKIMAAVYLDPDNLKNWEVMTIQAIYDFVCKK